MILQQVTSNEWISTSNEQQLKSYEEVIEEVIQKLENTAKTLFQWFSDNKLKLTLISVTFLCSTNNEVCLTIESQKIKNSKFEKLFGIELDSKLNFDSDIHDIWQKR